jgi:hypothetical protein
MKQSATCLFAGTTGVSADTTVLVHRGVALAFRRADAASFGARHKLRLHQHWARLRQT